VDGRAKGKGSLVIGWVLLVIPVVVVFAANQLKGPPAGDRLDLLLPQAAAVLMAPVLLTGLGILLWSLSRR
jgi:hypothetical protein